MIKTIDTRNITDIMLEAQNVIDGTTTYSDPLSFKDAADIFIAMAEAAPAVEPAQAVEPLDAPHPDYAEYITFEGSTRIVISPDDYEQLYNAATRRAPPAIDDETRELVLRLCRFVKFNAEHCTPNMNSLAKQICERMGAGK